jgi:hypothetical protein
MPYTGRIRLSFATVRYLGDGTPWQSASYAGEKFVALVCPPPPVVGSRVAEPSVVRGGAFSRVSREARVLPLGRAGRILVGSEPLEDTGLSSAGDDGPVLLMLMLGRGDRGPSLVFRNWGLEAKLITPGFPRQQLS